VNASCGSGVIAGAAALVAHLTGSGRSGGPPLSNLAATARIYHATARSPPVGQDMMLDTAAFIETAIAGCCACRR
jgi:hypothetical protein